MPGTTPRPWVSPSLIGTRLRRKAPAFAAATGGPVQTVEVLHGKATTNLTLTTASGTAVDDMLVVIQVMQSTTIATSDCVAPTGTAGTWANSTTVSGTQLAGKAWWRPVTAGGAQTITLAGAGAAVNFGWAYVLRGADLSGPVEASATNAGTSTATHAAPTVTSARTNGLLIGAWATKV